MTKPRGRPSRAMVGVLVGWSVLCIVALQVPFPHFLFFCEHVEAMYQGLADDAIVYHVMQTFVVLIWAAGVGLLVLGGLLAGKVSKRANSHRQ
ncbi:hypothetical protein [Trinickia fusca]|uniref:hypothetical protein n=1 Tax=Trinickia fusca TaxID=2419777 RepID=UPI0016043185|nr:hypothetical protein [Trinickia fusca]